MSWRRNLLACFVCLSVRLRACLHVFICLLVCCILVICWLLVFFFFFFFFFCCCCFVLFVCCCRRWQVWSVASVCKWRHVKLPEGVSPSDTRHIAWGLSLRYTSHCLRSLPQIHVTLPEVSPSDTRHIAWGPSLRYTSHCLRSVPQIHVTLPEVRPSDTRHTAWGPSLRYTSHCLRSLSQIHVTLPEVSLSQIHVTLCEVCPSDTRHIAWGPSLRYTSHCLRSLSQIHVTLPEVSPSDSRHIVWGLSLRYTSHCLRSVPQIHVTLPEVRPSDTRHIAWGLSLRYTSHCLRSVPQIHVTLPEVRPSDTRHTAWGPSLRYTSHCLRSVPQIHVFCDVKQATDNSHSNKPTDDRDHHLEATPEGSTAGRSGHIQLAAASTSTWSPERNHPHWSPARAADAKPACEESSARAADTVGCLLNQQQTSVSQGRICSDNFTCCHTEIEAADRTFYLTQSQYTDTGPTSPSADPIYRHAPGWVATGVPMFKSLVWLDPEKIPVQAGIEPGIFRSRGGRLTTRPARRSYLIGSKRMYTEARKL